LKKIDQSWINISSKTTKAGSSITKGNFRKKFEIVYVVGFCKDLKIKVKNCWRSIHFK